MKKFLIKNPELFQGQKYLTSNKNYFEGWYFKTTNSKFGIAFIPGISINQEEKKAFIQVITNTASYNINYNLNDFSYSNNPFFIKLGNNCFSKEGIHIDITDNKQNLIIQGDIKYSNHININSSVLNPNIMGPFSYLPFMECSHGILSMKCKAKGAISINDEKIKFSNGVGYIEKDWGCSFPKSYIWQQANTFSKSNASFMLSIADVPLKKLRIQGLICSLIVGHKEYRFATYNHTKIIKCEIENNTLNIILKKGKYLLQSETKIGDGLKLIAPVDGKMQKDIIESISATIHITLKHNNKIIFSDTSKNCGLEIVEP